MCSNLFKTHIIFYNFKVDNVALVKYTMKTATHTKFFRLTKDVKLKITEPAYVVGLIVCELVRVGFVLG